MSHLKSLSMDFILSDTVTKEKKNLPILQPPHLNKHRVCLDRVKNNIKI
jgi:hypothetical protein